MPSITLNHITKIEGHAKLYVEIKDNKVLKCELSSVEGSRYFEGILKGKHYYEAHEITSRICGICSCGHNVAATSAIENALGIEVSKQTLALKKLMTLGERIRSHATHLYFLALPDYMGYESALAMLPKYKKEVKRALSLMRFGNNLVKVIGGRDLHQVSMTVGGFLKIPKKQELDELAESAKILKEDAIETAKLFSKLTLYNIDDRCEHFSLHEKEEYAMLNSSLVSEKARFSEYEYLKYFEEYHNNYSTANFVSKDSKSFLVGSLSRINNNREQLSKDAKAILLSSSIKFPNTNPFTNNFCQAVELVHSMDQVIELCNSLTPKEERLVKPKLKKTRGVSAVEVPRGTLFHDYTLDKEGVIVHANIITPTALNLKNMEENIRNMLPVLIKKGNEEQVNLEIEKLIRCYDPCFSCSTHFLKVNWKRS
ncbi:MAG: Ni/Fe hydrogenase subunit alpha [Nanoarchaeota archaeon]|nr:Ni/Fe hydrogenase subunit alpha [Nanoarchaeota archaeon]